MLARKERSDYTEFFGDIKPIPDMIPVVGVATFFWRNREIVCSRFSGKRGSELAKEIALTVATLGSKDAPIPTDWKASIRAGTLAFRNIGFAFYHTSPLLIPLIFAS